MLGLAQIGSSPKMTSTIKWIRANPLLEVWVNWQNHQPAKLGSFGKCEVGTRHFRMAKSVPIKIFLGKKRVIHSANYADVAQMVRARVFQT